MGIAIVGTHTHTLTERDHSISPINTRIVLDRGAEKQTNNSRRLIEFKSVFVPKVMSLCARSLFRGAA
jgi:hypothetical protein